MIPELRALEAYRLDEDLGFPELARRMAKAGVPMSKRTLWYLIKERPAGSKPLDRTLYKIRKFLRILGEREQARIRYSRKAATAVEHL